MKNNVGHASWEIIYIISLLDLCQKVLVPWREKPKCIRWSTIFSCGNFSRWDVKGMYLCSSWSYVCVLGTVARNEDVSRAFGLVQ